MKRPSRFRRALLAPLVYLAAICLLLEEWLWDAGARAMQRLAALPPLRALERRLVRLPPYAALAAFALPAVLLLPVKILALLAISHGHPWSGLAVIVAAKVGGTALVAHLYGLTRQTLLTLPWFARWHARFLALKQRAIERLRATRAWRRATALARALRSALRAALPTPGMRGRLVRRWAAQWRARRR